MFGFLKQKIKESIEKIAGKAKEKEPVPEKIEKMEGVIEKIKKEITETKLKEEDLIDILDELKIGLLENDVALEVADKICGDVQQNLVGKTIRRGKEEETVKELFKSTLLNALKQEKPNLFDLIKRLKQEKGFALFLFLGFNGSGKTTTLAKIGYFLKKSGFSCVFAAGDTWRAASIEQLEIHGTKLGIRVVKHKYGSDPAAVIFDAANYAKANNIDVVLADTAGRSHANINLIDELKKICRVNKPDLKILVLDSLTGNDIYDQSKFFNDAVNVDAVILTKSDVYEKGAALSASHTIKKPILFFGTGQNYDDLSEFDEQRVVGNLLP